MKKFKVPNPHAMFGVVMLLALSVVGSPSTASAGILHYDFTPNSVLAASRKAHDYYLANGPKSTNTNWIDSAYHIGELEYFKVTGDGSAWDNTLNWAQTTAYRPYADPGKDPCIASNADHQSAGQVFFELAPTVGAPANALDCFKQSVLNTANTSHTLLWWWSDALYMAPASWAAMAQNAATPEERSAIYESIYDNFAKTRAALFNTDRGLFARDGRYIFPKNPSPGGSPMFWARGNGWAFAGLARLLERLPSDAPHYEEYRKTFINMADALRPLQQESGFWGADLLEPQHINQPETSGTSFFVYGMALGVRMNILDRATFMPTIERGWLALANRSLQDSGLLGWTQGVAHEPYMSYATKDSTKPYAVGTFLAASAEVYRLIAEPNVALGKPTTCSSEPQPDTAPCRQAVDGDINRRWSSNQKPSEIEIDLGAYTDLSAFKATFYYHRDYQYTVDVKLDADDQYRTVIDQQASTEGRPQLLAFPDQTTARFVRVRVTGANSYRGGWVSIGELEVYGQPSPLQRIAPANPPTCSAQPQPQYPCGAALDGRLEAGARWSAMTFPQSIEVDLGGSYEISGMALHTLRDRSYDYRLEVKTNASDTYHVAAEFAAGNGTGTVQSIAPVVARFARLTVTGIPNGSTNWVSIREWELYGEPVSPVPLQPAKYGCNNEPQAQFRCGKLFDGGYASTARWSTDGLGVVSIDLGAPQVIRTYSLATLSDRRYGYKIEALPPDLPDKPENYVVIEERDGPATRPGVQQRLSRPVNAEKLKLSVTSFPPGIIPWSSLIEFSMYG